MRLAVVLMLAAALTACAGPQGFEDTDPVKTAVADYKFDVHVSGECAYTLFRGGDTLFTTFNELDARKNHVIAAKQVSGCDVVEPVFSDGGATMLADLKCPTSE